MKIRLYNRKNDIVQVLALENGVLIRYDGNREIWCPNADCYLDDDYNLVVVSGPNGISMQITGEFLDWDCKMYVPACKAALELLFNSLIPEVQEQACRASDSIADSKTGYDVQLNRVIEYRDCRGVVDYDEETKTFIGILMDAECSIYFAGHTAQETVADFHKAVDYYLGIRASLIDLPEKSEQNKLDYIKGFRCGMRLGSIGTIQEYLKNIGCTDIPKGIRKLRKQTNKINRKYCRDKLEREGLWMRLTKDKKNTPATSATESLTGILKDNPDFDKAKLEDLRERYGPIDG